MTRNQNPHPGRILKARFLDPHDLSQTEAAQDMGVSPRQINEIVQGKRSVTPDSVLRLARYFGTTESYWLTLQDNYDLEKARLKKERKIQSIIEPLQRT